MKNKIIDKKTMKIIYIVGFIFLSIVVGVAGYLFFKKESTLVVKPTIKLTGTSRPATARAETQTPVTTTRAVTQIPVTTTSAVTPVTTSAVTPAVTTRAVTPAVTTRAVTPAAVQCQPGERYDGNICVSKCNAGETYNIETDRCIAPPGTVTQKPPEVTQQSFRDNKQLSSMTEQQINDFINTLSKQPKVRLLNQIFYTERELKVLQTNQEFSGTIPNIDILSFLTTDILKDVEIDTQFQIFDKFYNKTNAQIIRANRTKFFNQLTSKEKTEIILHGVTQIKYPGYQNFSLELYNLLKDVEKNTVLSRLGSSHWLIKNAKNNNKEIYEYIGIL